MTLLPMFSFFILVHCFSEAKFSSGYFFFAFSFNWIYSLFSSWKRPPSSYPHILFYPLSPFLLKKCSWKSWHHHTVPPSGVGEITGHWDAGEQRWDSPPWPLATYSMDMRTLSSLYSQWREISILRAQMPQSVLDYARLCFRLKHT